MVSLFFSREDEWHCRGGNWRFKCSKKDTVSDMPHWNCWPFNNKVFSPRPVLAFGYCCCLHLSVHTCVCPFVCQPWVCEGDNLWPIQTRIIKFGPEVQNTLVKIPASYYCIPRIRRNGGCYGFTSKPPAARNGVNAITQKPRDGLFSNLVCTLVVIDLINFSRS